MASRIQFFLLGMCGFLGFFHPVMAQEKNQMPGMTHSQNFESFPVVKHTKSADWKRLNATKYHKHPQFETLTATSPCDDCVEILEKRTFNHAYYRDSKNEKKVFIQSSESPMHFQKGDFMIRKDERMSPQSMGVFAAAFLPHDQIIDVNSKSTVFAENSLQFTFNRWSLTVQYPDGKNKVLQADWSKYTAGENGIKVYDVFPGMDMTIQSLQTGLKTNFIIRKNEFPGNQRMLLTDEYTEENSLIALQFENEPEDKFAAGSVIVSRNGMEAMKIGSASSWIESEKLFEQSRNILPYLIDGNKLSILIDAEQLKRSLEFGNLIIDPMVTYSATYLQSNILGSAYSGSCFVNSCDYHIDIPIPANLRITDLRFSFTYIAAGSCWLWDGALTFVAGEYCTSPPAPGYYYFCNNIGSGTCALNNVSIIDHVSSCLPGISTVADTFPVTMKFYRCYTNTSGCSNSCIGAGSDWVMTIMAEECDPVIAYLDFDGDGYSNGSFINTNTCDIPFGYNTAANLIALSGDCDDNNAEINPATVWYKDLDNDAYSDGTTLVQCLQPLGYKLASQLISLEFDCNDNNSFLHPSTVWYKDLDNDGYSDGNTLIQCVQPPGYKLWGDLIQAGGDCNDNDAAIHPFTIWYKDFDNDGYTDGVALEQCLPFAGYKLAIQLISLFPDCDDENALINPATIWYKDFDNDGYSDGVTIVQCLQPAGYKLPFQLISISGDCNDNNELLNPATIWYKDLDDDGYSDGISFTTCFQLSGYKMANSLISISGDCNDNDASINPTTVWYKDFDNDGYSDGTTSIQCLQPAGFKLITQLISTSGDCDDNNINLNPSTIWYKDLDNDGFSDGTALIQCIQPAGFKLAGELIALSGDCNDNDGNINPSVAEICNEVDDNCNGQIDESHSISAPWNHIIFNQAIGDAFINCSDSSDKIDIHSSSISASNSDKYHVVNQLICGDFEIFAKAELLEGTGWAGIEMRESNVPGSRKFLLKSNFGHVIFREIRSVLNGTINSQSLVRPGVSWLKLKRSGNQFIGYTSANGSVWNMAFSTNLAMPSCINAGLLAQSINNSQTIKVSFSEVEIHSDNTFEPNINISASQAQAANWILYPNPVEGKLYLKSNQFPAQNTQVHIMDSFGRICLKAAILSDLNEFDIQLLPGVYFIRIFDQEAEIEVIPFIKI